jgi:hypothetical protein
LYNVVPGTGPIYAFGQDFPWKALPYRDLPRFVLGKMIIPTTIPRNAMPSLHVGWAVLLVWNSRKFPVALRSAILIFLIFTVFATLGSGQHYLVDLIGSLPFALTVQAGAFLVFRNESVASKSQLVTAALAGLTLTLAWLAVVRFGVEIALKTPIIPWTLVLATASAALWLRRWISEPDASLLPVASKPRTTEEKSRELVSR